MGRWWLEKRTRGSWASRQGVLRRGVGVLPVDVQFTRLAVVRSSCGCPPTLQLRRTARRKLATPHPLHAAAHVRRPFQHPTRPRALTDCFASACGQEGRQACTTVQRQGLRRAVRAPVYGPHGALPPCPSLQGDTSAQCKPPRPAPPRPPPAALAHAHLGQHRLACARRPVPAVWRSKGRRETWFSCLEKWANVYLTLESRRSTTHSGAPPPAQYSWRKDSKASRQRQIPNVLRAKRSSFWHRVSVDYFGLTTLAPIRSMCSRQQFRPATRLRHPPAWPPATRPPGRPLTAAHPWPASTA